MEWLIFSEPPRWIGNDSRGTCKLSWGTDTVKTRSRSFSRTNSRNILNGALNHNGELKWIFLVWLNTFVVIEWKKNKNCNFELLDFCYFFFSSKFQLMKQTSELVMINKTRENKILCKFDWHNAGYIFSQNEFHKDSCLKKWAICHIGFENKNGNLLRLYKICKNDGISLTSRSTLF